MALSGRSELSSVLAVPVNPRIRDARDSDPPDQLQRRNDLR